MNDKYERQLKKGVFEILVLKLLTEEEKYGYQLINELKEKSRGRFVLKEGTLYPILYRLEEDKLVTSSWSQPSAKTVAKKYYHITRAGEAVLQELITLWHSFDENVNDILQEEYREK